MNKNPLHFNHTCDLIYSLASDRITDAFLSWQGRQKSKGLKGDLMELSPDSRPVQTIIGNIMDGTRGEDNPYLVTPKALKVCLEELNFNDENEILWGSDPLIYFQSLFETMIEDMGENREYCKHWNGFDLSSSEKIRTFYDHVEVTHRGKLDNLKELFLDFIFDSVEATKTVNSNGIIEFHQLSSTVESLKKSKLKPVNSKGTLPFKKLPESLQILASYVFIPFFDEILLDNLTD